MIKGRTTTASIHITRLSDYKPFAEGVMAVRVLQNGRLIGSGDTDKPRIPGIFPVQFTASSAGNVSLQFVFTAGGLKDSVTVPSAIVFENEDQANNAPPVEDPAGVIKFTKEMAWKIDFSVLKVVPREYLNTFKVSGELAIPPSEVNTICAKSDGILVFSQADLVPGARVAKGTVLFTLTGQGLTSRNMDANFAAIKSRFESSRAAYEREKPLVKDQIVSQKQFNETMTRFRIDSTQYFTYLYGFSGNSMNITATEDGYVQQVFQSNGAFVTEGTPLIAIANTNKILLRADLPQRYWQDLSLVRSASFRPAGSNQVYDIEAMGGKLVAKGSAVSAENQFIPVSFEFPNKGSFVAGTFAEVFLHTTPLAGQIVIPVSALLEEQGNYYVYVQTAGESFMKRTVTPGFIDGLFVNIPAGLKAGDTVVTRGAIFIKASSQMTGTPSHGHEH
jgi:RND family efflux transporter MFP subunit